MSDTSLTYNDIDGRHPRPIQEKWGDALGSGFQVIPNILLRSQKALGLKTTDIVVLLNLTAHWWTKEDRPYISPSNIAKRIDVSTRTVERHLKSLEKKGFLKRCKALRKDGGIYIRHYDLQPLVKKLEEASNSALDLRVRQKQFRSLSDTERAALAKQSPS